MRFFWYDLPMIVGFLYELLNCSESIFLGTLISRNVMLLFRSCYKKKKNSSLMLLRSSRIVFILNICLLWMMKISSTYLKLSELVA
jgi:hypothetical protein